MALKPGTMLGPYEILAQIGAGGMGEVYKARDTRLERIVAIKVLPPQMAERADARERFEREARTIANLKHPNICVLYDIGQQDGIQGQPGPVHYLVLEFLEGETLGQRLMNEPLPLEQVLRYATEVADALDKAHRKGFTHRDVKPANIMLTKEGSKVLDFGLAKLKQEAERPNIPLSQMPTGVGTLTDEGTILGTLQYMAPEQVEGKIDELDARTDIFAFGAVVYEMATGKKAFEGKSQASVIGAIMKGEPPPMSSLQPMTPSALDEAVKRCLAKDPNERWQSAHDLAWELERIKRAATPAPLPIVAPAPARSGKWNRFGWAAAAVLAVIAIALAIPYFRPNPNTESQAIRFSISPPDEAITVGNQAAVSPDGTRVAYATVDTSGKTLLWVRSLDSPVAQPLPGTGGTSSNGIFWSPDSRAIGFVAGGKLKTIPIAGGPVQVLADAYPRGGAWSRDGTILFTTGPFSGLSRAPATGGNVASVTKLDSSRGERAHRWPQFLPDGRHFLYSVLGAPQENSGVYVGSLDSAETTRLFTNSFQAQYVPPGYLFFVQGRSLMAQPFDAGRLETSGEPSFVADGFSASASTSFAAYSVSERGVLAYASSGDISATKLLWFDRTGKQLGTVDLPGPSAGPELSPDEKRVAINVGGAEPNDIWVLELGRGIPTRFTSDAGADRFARWSPDGTRLLFHSNRGTALYNLYQKSLSSAESEQLFFQSNDSKYPMDWSRDGRFVIYASFESGGPTTADLWVLPLSGEKKPVPFLKTQFQETQAQFSPDGKWIAYVSNESGRDEVYVSSFPGATGKIRVSTNGGVQPRWRGDGKEMFYLSADRRMMAAPVQGGATLEVGAPSDLFEVHFIPRDTSVPNAFHQYDVTADGQRFLVNAPPENPTVPITVVLNWMAGLKKQ